MLIIKLQERTTSTPDPRKLKNSENYFYILYVVGHKLGQNIHEISQPKS